MKTTKALAIGLVLTAITTAHTQDLADVPTVKRPQPREESHRILNFPKVEANYLINLNSEVPAVVESALGHVTLMRIKYPTQALKEIQRKLYELASQGATRSIRYKAFTAMQVFANPVDFKGAIVDRQASGDGLLEEIAAKQ